MDVDTILDVIAIVSAVVAVFISIRKSKHEIIQADGAAASSFADAAETLIAPLKARIDELSAALEKEKCARLALEDKLASWQDWAERLVAQVKSLGHEPVPFKAKTKEGRA